MEPLFFKAENSDEEEDMACDCDASMEPLFFKAENICSTQGEFTRLIELQWSRFFSKRKIFLSTSFVKCPSGFNGAAFFQSRKCRTTAPQVVHQPASMEPLFFKAENPLSKKRSL